MRLARILCALASALAVSAYVPAVATNDTNAAIAGGLNVTDISSLSLQWFSNGSYSQHVSYQLAGAGSTGISKGVLVHFSEDMADNSTAPTSTPWIALVSCDRNSTNASEFEDVFTLARDKGAVAAVLYTLSAAACIINPEYADPANFDQVFDIFSTQSLTSAHLIEYQFGQLAQQNKTTTISTILDYKSDQLNNSFNDISQSVNLGYAVSPGYLLAVLQAYNATGAGTDPSNTGGSSGSTGPQKSNSPNTALAMIVLYAITGCVSALFCVVIISGAIRAIRHPERYGPRSRFGEQGGYGQSRARGLTRAILDTFPIVKFGNAPVDPQHDPSQEAAAKDVETAHSGHSMEMASVPHRNTSSPSANDSPHDDLPALNALASGSNDGANSRSTDSLHASGTDRTKSPSQRPDSTVGETSATGLRRSRDQGEGQNQAVRDDVVPASIGRDTCPICIVDFEEGDDIRVLPCEGKHCFHQTCVDPWLLELSSSCPICRQDFLALENMISGNTDDGDHDHEQEEVDHRASQHRPHSHGTPGRFSRYLRFAHRRQRQRRGDDADPTDPYMPPAPATSMYSGM